MIEATSDSHKMYAAVRAITRTAPQKLLLRDSTGKYILRGKEANNIVRDHFQDQFLHPARTLVVPDTTAKALDNPITPDEFQRALRRLNSNRAADPDEIPAELLKSVADELTPRLTELLNRSFARGEPIDLGKGTLFCLQKPNKPRGVCSSLFPIVLLNTIRKAVSLIVLHRITPAVTDFLSGFRKYRSTADAVWAHKWVCAQAQKFQDITHILGIDLSRAFDTIDRAKLLEVLRTFLPDDEIRLIQLLLSNTTLSLRVGKNSLSPFHSNTGTPQGESLSPVLFVIYLEAAFRDLVTPCHASRSARAHDRICGRRGLHLS
ncbi:Very-long-chain enoyl-CoA reductase [Phytophthora nicotianae]|uniref:Very-long-chain enoyl-CoA reductase n=1 Tax=Phytophthora nicotianae TaxID=4792 RepID=A0A0W8D8Q1_PHYNI|nr:Very-long-chain enoyl-CoA reductase [Phytophthora nicotianae]